MCLNTETMKILTDSNVNRNTSIQEIFDSFGGSDKLAPINCLSKIAHIKDDKDTFLVEESIGKRIKDMAIFFATIIPVAVAVIQLSATTAIIIKILRTLYYAIFKCLSRVYLESGNCCAVMGTSP